MSNETPKLPLALVVLTSIAVLSSALICVNMHMHRENTFLPMSIVAAAGLLALGIAARR